MNLSTYPGVQLLVKSIVCCPARFTTATLPRGKPDCSSDVHDMEYLSNLIKVRNIVICVTTNPSRARASSGVEAPSLLWRGRQFWRDIQVIATDRVGSLKVYSSVKIHFFSISGVIDVRNE
ncbi:unnamed protein product [Leptidea sinapis]|uniref:Uncharacterized protein n=1 Tax=Leptidea sinapis TaxID=189913 RepID=A0A5E4R1V7_9NEOP|nr:unnamed protein product [Leptidea sinapis]